MPEEKKLGCSELDTDLEQLQWVTITWAARSHAKVGTRMRDSALNRYEVRRKCESLLAEAVEREKSALLMPAVTVACTGLS
jgi:hypothetical protein